MSDSRANLQELQANLHAELTAAVEAWRTCRAAEEAARAKLPDLKDLNSWRALAAACAARVALAELESATASACERVEELRIVAHAAATQTIQAQA